MEKYHEPFVVKNIVNIILINHSQDFKVCVVEQLIQNNVKKMNVIVGRKRLIAGIKKKMRYYAITNNY